LGAEPCLDCPIQSCKFAALAAHVVRVIKVEFAAHCACLRYWHNKLGNGRTVFYCQLERWMHAVVKYKAVSNAVSVQARSQIDLLAFNHVRGTPVNGARVKLSARTSMPSPGARLNTSSSTHGLALGSSHCVVISPQKCGK